MSDFTTINLQYNSGAGTDASPVWTGAAVAFNTANNEIRWGPSSGTGASVGSASWPFVTRPTSGTATVPQLWSFTADTTGLQVVTYTGDNTKANVLRWNWDALGTMVAAPNFTMYADTTHTAPSAGTQPPGTHNDAITNGQSTDTSSTSYLKYNAWGTFQTTNLTAGAVGTNPSATTGTAGATTCTSGNWLNTAGAWTSAQGLVQYIVAASTPAATTANNWNWTCVLFTGQNQTTGTWTPVFTLTYTYA